MARELSVSVGDRAPEFSMEDQNGKRVELADLTQRGWVVLYFYPKDDTPGCTAEACAFRDDYSEFSDAGAEVVGVSSDSLESHRDFAKKHRVPFSLLSDADGALRKRFGVPKTFGLFPDRVTYVIDSQGIVRHIFNSQLRATEHIRQALQVLKDASV